MELLQTTLKCNSAFQYLITFLQEILWFMNNLVIAQNTLPTYNLTK